jgi:GT2 family glycosyltransferase
MRASLIVLNYNGATVVEQCLESIVAAMGPDDELIVVDNASTDGSGELVRGFCARGERRTFIPRAVNNYIFGLTDGIAVATGRYVGLFNNDNRLDATSIDRMLACFDTPAVFAACPRIVQERNGKDQGALTAGFWKHGLLFYTTHAHSDLSRGTFFAVGGQSIFDRQKLVDLGSLDDLLYPMYHEDIELSWRAWKAGYEIRYAPDAVVRHIGGHSSNRVFSPSELRSFVRQNEFLTVWKNVTDQRLMAEHIALLPLRLAVACLKRDWPTVKGFWSALRRFRRVRTARARTRLSARISDQEVLRRVSPEGLGICES